MGKTFKKTCECDAYDFPHRPGSGRCDGESQYRHHANPSKPRRVVDEMLDDPRHGQAKDINSKNRSQW